ncbi:MAG: ABC transporter permease, partial [Planctomycetaceae bacterium]|nr:ABC transporter permease [Planctomycetaceae bacterium]
MNQTPIPTTDEQPDKSSKRMELQRLAEVMSVAQSQQGVSLWSDGWKRLKRNRVSMLSLWTLVIIVVLAIITPALPLQSPIFQDVKQRELLSPEFKTYKLGIVDYNETLALKRQTLIEMGPLDDQRAALQAEIEGLEARHPINVYWNDPGFISQAMIKFRIFIFGDYCIPSICGTDKLGRDVLSRVCWGSRVSLACGLIATLVSLLIGVSYGAISGYFGGRIDNIMMRIIDVAYSIPFIFIVIFIMSFLSAPKVRDTLNEYGINQITVFFLMIG